MLVAVRLTAYQSPLTTCACFNHLFLHNVCTPLGFLFCIQCACLKYNLFILWATSVFWETCHKSYLGSDDYHHGLCQSTINIKTPPMFWWPTYSMPLLFIVLYVLWLQSSKWGLGMRLALCVWQSPAHVVKNYIPYFFNQTLKYI